MNEKYFNRFRHDMKNRIIELQFVMEDHHNKELTDAEYLKRLNDIVKEFSEQTNELAKKVAEHRS